jgi:putative hydrolase of the HAD superfamily
VCQDYLVTIRAVIFDIGGVLEIDPATDWLERWAGRLGLGGPDMGARLEPISRAGNIGTITLTQAQQQIAAVLGLDDAQLGRFMADLWTEYLGTLNTELARYFGALRPRYKTGMLSNSFVGARERERAAYGFEDLCDVVVYSHEEGLEKPDPRFYRIVTDRLGVRPGEAVFLDDREEFVQGARDVGMNAVLFGGNEQAIADLEAHLRG